MGSHETESIDEVDERGAAFVREEDGGGPPKMDGTAEELDEKVKKQIIKPGHGEAPPKHSTCFLHYRGWTVGTGHKFEDTWAEQKPVELILGKEKKEMRGLAVGVSSMRTGERALLHVGWELGYGSQGNFSFPSIPSMADLVYEVELIGFDEGRARGDMTVEERIDAADRWKTRGNDLFKEEKFDAAMQQYEMGLAYMGDDFMFQLFGKYRDIALAVKNPCHLNMSACLIKLGQHEEAVRHCGMVLSEDDKSVKALYRRGKARMELGQTDAAREDFARAGILSPDNRAIAHEVRALARHDRAVYRKQREIYRGIFGPPPDPNKTRFSWILSVWHLFLSRLLRLFKPTKSKAH